MRVSFGNFILSLALSVSGLHAQNLTDSFLLNPDQDTDELIDNWGLDPEEVSDPFRGGTRAGEFQENFNSGKVATTLGTSDGAARAGVIQSDGRVVLVGRNSNAPQNDFAIIRFFPDGSIDTGFGTNGRVYVTYGTGTGSDEVAHAAILQTDGKILVAGKAAASGTYAFAVARLNADGTLDTTFNGTGKVTTGVYGTADIARAMVVDTQQRIILGGYGYNAGKFDAAVVRYSSNGVLDTAFDLDGIKTITVTANDNGILAIELDTLNRILAASNAYNGSDWDFVVLRFMTEGALDTTFKSNGKLTVSFGTSDDIPYGLVTHTDSTIAVAGSSVDNAGLIQFALARILSNGVMDTAFNLNGKTTLDIGGTGINIPYSVKAQTDGKLIIGGKAKATAQFHFALARYNLNGTLDTSYNSTGKFTGSIASGENSAQTILMWGDDLVYLAGRANDGSALNAAMMRFATNGALGLAGKYDVGFGTSGFVYTAISGQSSAYELMAQRDVKLIAAAIASDTGLGGQNRWSLVRYNLDGNLDTTFASRGIAIDTTYQGLQLGGAVISTDGTILTVERDTGGLGFDLQAPFRVARYRTDGILDTSFNSTGYVMQSGASGQQSSDVALQTDGKYVISVDRKDGSASIMVQVVRYLTSGNLDTSFHTDGFSFGTSLGTSRAIVLQTDGKPIVLGHLSGNYYQTRVSRYTTDGRLDTSFSSSGQMEDSFLEAGLRPMDLALNGGGLTVVAHQRIGVVGQIALSVYRTDGFFDTSFDTEGHALGVSGQPVRLPEKISIMGWNKIVGFGGGNAISGSTWRNFMVVRYLSNGTLDTTFTSSGAVFNTGGALHEDWTAGVITPKGKICGLGVSSTNLAVGCYWP